MTRKRDKLDKEGSFAVIYDLIAEALKNDDPIEAAKYRQIAKELRVAEEKNKR